MPKNIYNRVKRALKKTTHFYLVSNHRLVLFDSDLLPEHSHRLIVDNKEVVIEVP